MVENSTMTEAPSSVTYSYDVSRGSVYFSLLIAELNELDIMVRNVGNTYLNEPCQENIWFTAVTEHGTGKTGKLMVMVRDLYVLNSSEAYWRTMSAVIFRDMGFVPTVADSDIYCRRSRKPNGE